MKKFLITCAILLALFGTTGIIQADEPFVRISTTPDEFQNQDRYYGLCGQVQWHACVYNHATVVIGKMEI